MKKILHIFRNLKYGGNQALALNIIKYSSLEYKHSILSFQDDLEMKKEFEELGCDIRVIEQKETNFSEFKNKYTQFMIDNDFDTAVTWFYPYILRLELDGVNFVHHIGTAPVFKFSLLWLKSFILVNMYKKSNGKFIFASNHIAKQNKKVYGINFKNSSIVLNGIDTSRFKSKSTYTKRDKFIITMVGRLDGSKDFDTLIKIAPILAKDIDNLTINIVGDGDDRVRLENLSKEHNSNSIIKFLGRRSDVDDILHDSDIFVFLNKFLEGFGLVIVEAMSTGLPVVSYNIGANSEIIDDGIDGYLVNSKDELIEKILKLYNSEDLMKRIGQNGYKKAKAKFDVRDMVKEYEKRY
jgi:glycosyltransferase involved in cell wall biosynthesis